MSCAIMLAGATCAEAAKLVGVKGKVLVNRGNGYELGTEGMDLKPGDTVITNPGGEAQVVYEDGVTAGVQPGNVVTVGDLGAGAGAVVAESSLGTGALVVGGLAVAGLVGVVVGVSNSKDKPASP